MFGAKVGHRVNIYPSAHIYFPWNFETGCHAVVGQWALIYNLGKVTIGARITVSQWVCICAGTHDYRDPSMSLVKPKCYAGEESWICAGAFIW